MNIRTTSSINETFLEILTSCKERQINAAMFLDAEGVIRAEGLIRAIYVDVPKPYLELESGIKIVIKTIRAVNGFFLPPFSAYHISRNR
ncbi:MAG TPA: hypothetical protein PLL71_14555 [Agriterribacter sp.]|nr:hypothetical protein [Agriterribacter sp.]